MGSGEGGLEMKGIEAFVGLVKGHSNGPEGSLRGFARQCYKATDCGAWVSFKLADGRRVGGGGDPNVPVVSEGPERVVEIIVGSIVEGSDAEIGPYRLAVDENFEQNRFWWLLQRVDREASDAWDEAHAEDEEDVR
jgi:hypothetical protein